MLWLAWLLACEGDPPPTRPAPAKPFTAPAPQRLDRDPGPPEGLAPDPRTLLLFLADTVRQDRLSVCGHARPTTPTLEALRDGGAQVRCDGVSTSSWTVPAVASMLTGLSPWEHGVHRHTRALGDCGYELEGALIPELKARTWLEELRDQGWRTVCVVENKLISADFGLTRGCQTWIQVHKWADLTPGSEDLLDFVTEAVSKADPRPLALLVDAMDAHRRLPDIPEGHPFLAAQVGPGHGETWDELRVDPEGPLRQRYDDHYDMGVWRMDRKLGQVLAAVAEHRPGPRTLLFASDHGEMLGESGFVSHGNGIWDPLVRVPVVVDGSPHALPEGPFSTAVLHDLALDRPPTARAPRALTTGSLFWHDRFYPPHSRHVEVVEYTPTARLACREAGCTQEVWPGPPLQDGAAVEALELARLRSELPRALDCDVIGDAARKGQLLQEVGAGE